MLEQPSLLSSLRNAVTASTVEPMPPDRLGGLGTFSSLSPTEERSPDGVSSASEATEAGQDPDFSQNAAGVCHRNTLTDPSIQLADSLFTFENLFLFVWSPCASPSCPSSPEPPGSSLQHRELFRPSAQHIREQQSVFFWSQRPPPLTAGSTKTRGHRQPVSGQHRPHEGKDLLYSKALQFVV